ncbi:hypothetical protein ACWDTI_22035 [Gordonia sp. NPDC003424]
MASNQTRARLTRADVTPTERRMLAAALHESAHAIAGFVCGLDVERVRLFPNNPRHAGACEFARHPGGTPPLVAYAGTVAELRWTLGCRPSAYQVSARLDTHREDRAIVASAGTFDLDHARGLVDRCWPAVTTLARSLYVHGEVGEGDVIKALRVPPGPAGDRYVAELRSGYRAVS